LSAKYIAVFRRRRQGKTDYRKRRALVISRLPYLTVRITSRNVYAQLSKAEVVGDKTLASANSIQLSKFGWKGGTKNIPACYLTGLLLGKRSSVSGPQEAVLYTGLRSYRSGSRLAAVVKGALDSGLKVRVSEETLPQQERLQGMHVSSYAKALKEQDPEGYQRRFSALIRKGLPPEEVTENFTSTKEAIIKGGQVQ
jgi:large subunit ribosomal protein L18